MKATKENINKAKTLGTENVRIAINILTPKFSSREQVDMLLRKEGFRKEYIKSDPENDFTRNMKSGYYYSKDGVCAYETCGIILIALFMNEIEEKIIIKDNPALGYKTTSDITDAEMGSIVKKNINRMEHDIFWLDEVAKINMKTRNYIRMAGLAKILKTYGSIKVIQNGKTVTWLYDYKNDKPRLKSEMTKQEIIESRNINNRT
jgi:hypothetical protein